MIKSNLGVFFALLLPLGNIHAQVTEFMLDNGMKVIVKENHRAPLFVSQVWYKVGSSYETDGITGISHALEHMMFKGTAKYKKGEFSKTIAALGGTENAFTSRDYTAYFETLSKPHLAKALELEADRMHSLLLDADEFAKEVEVVKEERRLRTEDKPTGKLYEQFNAVAWRSSSYRNPVIGWMNDLDHMTKADLQSWYEQWYAPQNATLVVAGDVEPKEVLKLAKQYFGVIPRGNEIKFKLPMEPKQKGQTRVVVEVPAKQPYLMMGFKVPVATQSENDWEAYALAVLAAVLDGGDSARFSRHLVREKAIAASAGADYNLYARLSGMFLLDGTPNDGKTIADLEAALLDEIENVKKTLVSEQELNRIITQLIASKVYQQDSLFYQAMLIGTLETVGQDWRLLDKEVELVKRVTPEQIQTVAKKYLNKDNLTIAELKPLSMAVVSETTTPKIKSSTKGASNEG